MKEVQLASNPVGGQFRLDLSMPSPYTFGFMLAEALKNRYLIAGAALFPVALMLILFVSGRENLRLPWMQSSISIEPSGADAIAQMREFLAKEQRQLGQFEREQSTLRAEVIRQRKLLQEGQLSKEQVKQTELLFVAALKRVHEMRYTVTETDIAITEAVLGEKVLRMPALPIGGFSQTAELTRFNGPFKWSIAEAPRVEKFFSQTFGRRLPITALGQSDIHNRLRFDHRDAMDVGLHPDSGEGRALVGYLRKSGIPFLAFRSAIPGAATGPHIHIGRPSHRY